MNALMPAFSEQFRDADTPYLSPERVSVAFGFQVQELAELARVHRNTVTARPQAAMVQRRLQDLLGVLQLATEITGDRARAIFLLRNEPLRVFDGSTAIELVKNGRAEDVKSFLRSIAGGAAG